MLSLIKHIFGPQAADIRGKVIGIGTVLIAANLGAWAWALITFQNFPLLLGTSLLAYSFGLRHAVDADHIAAIDNVTRKLMHEDKRPVAVGLFFSLGHSTIVVLASVAVAATAMAFKQDIDGLHQIGGLIGTLVSASFLLIIAAINLVILRESYTTFRHVRSGGRLVAEDVSLLLAQGGFFARICRPMFSIIRRSWHMYPLGIVFGLGFDTATEVGLLGISAAEASHGLSIWSILVFPALFTAGMALVDTFDGILMLHAYGWAFVKPVRKLYYNMTITAVSVIVAVVIGGIEALGLVGHQLSLGGSFWRGIASVNNNFGIVGCAIIGLFVAAWIISFVIYRLRRYDDLDSDTAIP